MIVECQFLARLDIASTHIQDVLFHDPGINVWFAAVVHILPVYYQLRTDCNRSLLLVWAVLLSRVPHLNQSFTAAGLDWIH